MQELWESRFSIKHTQLLQSMSYLLVTFFCLLSLSFSPVCIFLEVACIKLDETFSLGAYHSGTGKIITSHPLVHNILSNNSQNGIHISTFCHIGDSLSFSNLQ